MHITHKFSNYNGFKRLFWMVRAEVYILIEVLNFLVSTGVSSSKGMPL